MIIYQSRSFEKKVKKMSKPEKDSLDREIRSIADDPSVGEEKKGDLRGVFVHKFKLKTTQYLLAYRKVGEDLELLMIGPHENYYRDLKQYLKNETVFEKPMRGGVTMPCSGSHKRRTPADGHVLLL
ncbi:MAG: hypothetical protein FD151_2353 [bacterium]|nr:MAG: hypothetical protein FD151_2353 [bacterium]